MIAHIAEAIKRANSRTEIANRLAEQCVELSNMDYDFLFDKSQNLLAIGYNIEEHRRDNSFYDLLGSEARLGVFVAIAQGKIPQESWFALGRQLTNATGAPILLSWSGSMFEYLMPLLVMPTYRNTLLDQTYKSTVQKQIDYGRQRDVAWGVSESGYNMFDSYLNYQYRAFGVPGLGLKRGLGEDLVIALANGEGQPHTCCGSNPEWLGLAEQQIRTRWQCSRCRSETGPPTIRIYP